MTEKRFMVDDAGTLIDMQTRDIFDIVEEVCPLLNEQHETIERLKQNIDELLSVNVEEQLLKENEELKQRNDRQAKRLDNLYCLIEEKDWRTLSDILDDFKRCEEQLQREWKCYDDF